MDISVYSFVDAAQRAAPLMPSGGSIITMTYLGSERAIPNYNTMGVAKAALEACDPLHRPRPRPRGIRVNAHLRRRHAHPVAGRHHGRPRHAGARAAHWSALKEDTSMEGVAGCALWLLSDLGRSTTGEVVHVDAGFHMMGLPSEEEVAPAGAS